MWCKFGHVTLKIGRNESLEVFSVVLAFSKEGRSWHRVVTGTSPTVDASRRDNYYTTIFDFRTNPGRNIQNQYQS